MITMYDSIEASQIPRDAQAAASYVDGWGGYAAVRARLPRHIPVLRITGHGHVADVLDIEPGNPVPASQAGPWVRSMLRHGIWRPCIYASLSNMGPILDSLHHAGLHRREFRLWVAEWTGHPHIPTGYDACQWTDRGPHGTNADISLCRDDFFQPPPRPVHVPVRPPPTRKPEPKVTAATLTAGFGVALTAVLRRYHVHITPAEAGAISTVAALLGGYLAPPAKR